MLVRLLSLVPVALFGLSACGGGGSSDPGPATGTLELTVVDVDTSDGLESARVVVVDGSTGESIDVLETGETGTVNGTYEVGTIQLMVSRQDYGSSPPPGFPALPVEIAANETTAITVSLEALAEADRGSISGTVAVFNGQPATGALIVAMPAGGVSQSTLAHLDGTYVLHNVPAGSVTLQAFFGGQNFDSTEPVSVTANANTVQNIMATGIAVGEIFGHISFTSVSGDIIDITLLHPSTRDKLPNLVTFTDEGSSYAMSGVPFGEFEIIASLENDGFVLDPDTSVTQGIPAVTVTESSPVIANMDFKVTGSIDLTNPPPVDNSDVPELGGQPTFSWNKASSYASADYYVVEVVDESGETVWGGFDSAESNFAPLVTVPQGNDPAATYNFDATAALAALTPDRYFQLRVYAAVVDESDARGFRLLSASETLDGIFQVAAAP